MLQKVLISSKYISTLKWGYVFKTHVRLMTWAKVITAKVQFLIAAADSSYT